MKVTEVLEFAKHKINEVKRSLGRIEQQRQLLNQREEELKQALARWESIAQELSHEPEAASVEFVDNLSSMRLSDACYNILKAVRHGLHAKELVSELEKHGRPIHAKNPVDSVHKMLLRDRRFYRPGDHGTYWELEEWQVPSGEETKGAQE